MVNWGVRKSKHKPDHRKAENKESEIKSIREDLEKLKSRPEGSNRTRDLTFITLRNLRKVIDRDRLRKLLQEFRWYKEALLEHIYTQFLRIVGILISVEWPDWENFPAIFLEPLDPLGRPSRGDIHLPFIDVHFLTHTTSQRLFELDQYIFCPITIKENSHDVISNKKRRLPFLSSSSIGGGGSGTVSKVEVEKYQILFTAGQAGGEPNTKVSIVCTIPPCEVKANLNFPTDEMDGAEGNQRRCKREPELSDRKTKFGLVQEGSHRLRCDPEEFCIFRARQFP
jgi:hypothetical protein